MKNREYGTVATWNGSYCFVTPDSGEKDVFCRASQLPTDKIHRGDRVSFDLAPDNYKPGRMCAKQVQIVNGDENQNPSV